MGLFDLSSVVQSLANETATVRRFARDTYDSHGVALARVVAATFTPRCSVQPISGSEAKLLPEALRTSNSKSIWAPIALAEGDLITVAEGVFKVFKVVDWSLAGTYSKAIMIKVDESEGV